MKTKNKRRNKAVENLKHHIEVMKGKWDKQLGHIIYPNERITLDAKFMLVNLSQNKLYIVGIEKGRCMIRFEE